jgi:multicomponent Na+:H+ antiporter subunit D
LVTGAIQVHAWVFVAVLIASSLLSAVYFFRVIEWAYLREPERDVTSDIKHQELPVQMLLPILLLATSVLLLGLFNQTVISRVIQYALPQRGF